MRGRTVILVDDGLATGATMRAAAVKALRQQQPARIVVAVPVALAGDLRRVAASGRRGLCAVTPEPFYAVGLWYEDFSQTTDEEVRELLARAADGSADAFSKDDPAAAGRRAMQSMTDPRLIEALREDCIRCRAARRLRPRSWISSAMRASC